MSSYAPNITQIQEVNSTTYADTIGLQFGLPRLLGETATQYVKRLEFAANLTRTAPYPGALNNINLSLGLEPAPYINLQLTDPSTGPYVVTSSIAGIVINNTTVPLLTFDQDTMWDWQMLSEVVANINFIPNVTATLLVPDGPAFQIARQTNSLWSFAEEVTGIQYQLKFSGVVAGSVLFDQNVPPYTLTGSLLTFSSEPPAGTHITYNYIIGPYNLVGSPVALIGLTDPEFASVAETSNGVLAYQVSEFVQNIMGTDLSYWGS